METLGQGKEKKDARLEKSVPLVGLQEECEKT